MLIVLEVCIKDAKEKAKTTPRVDQKLDKLPNRGIKPITASIGVRFTTSLFSSFGPFGLVDVLRQYVARIGVGPNLVHDQEKTTG